MTLITLLGFSNMEGHSLAYYKEIISKNQKDGKIWLTVTPTVSRDGGIWAQCGRTQVREANNGRWLDQIASLMGIPSSEMLGF